MTDRTAARSPIAMTPRLENLEPRRLLAAGDLVTAFGTDGRAEFAFDGRDWQSVDEVVQLDDGSIYVIGESGDIDTTLPTLPRRPDAINRQDFVAKLTPSGSLDTSFGNGGVQVVDSLNWPDDQPLMGLRPLPDGDLLGHQVVLGEDPSADPFYRLVRLNPDLSVDTAFGSGGVLVINRPSVDWDLLPSGGLAVFSETFDGDGSLTGSPNALLQLYNADGTPRAGGSADLDAILPQADLTISDVAVDSRGRILLAAGSSENFSFDPNDTRGAYAAAFRLNPDLSFDTGFGDSGFATHGFGDTDIFRASHVAAGPNDSVALIVDEDDNEQSVVLFDENGTTQFTANRFRFGTSDNPAGGSLARNEVHRAWVQPDGKVLVTGNYVQDPEQDALGDPNLAYAVQRFNTDGSDDTGFDGGQVVLAGSDNIRIHDAHFTDDGDLLLGGTFEDYTIESGQLTSYEQQAVVLKLDLGDVGTGDGGGDDGGGDDGGGDNGGDNGGGDDGGGDDGGSDPGDDTGDNDSGAGDGDTGGGDGGDDDGEPAPDQPTATLIPTGGERSTVRIEGTDNADAISIRLEDGRIVVRSGDTVLDDYDPADVGNVELFGNGGDDLIDSTLGIGAIAGFVTLRGGDGDDTLLSSARYDRQYGDAGNDTLTVRGDQGLLFGGAGNDTLTGAAGRDLLEGGDGADVLVGGGGSDGLFGGAGNDALDAGDGDDTLVGGSGHDTHTGGAGIDLIHYIGRGSDVTINLADGTAGTSGENDVLSGIENALGGNGEDLITGSIERNFLLGGPGNDSLFGSDGKDTLEGNAGNDLLDGGIDFDWLIDTEGDNTLRGGGGFDVGYANDDDDFGDDVERITTTLDDFLDAI